MTKLVVAVLIACWATLGTGCAIISAPVVPPTAAIYTNIEAPMDVNYEATQLGSKMGKASSNSVLGLIAWGDASAATAARNGNISTIRHADYQYQSVLLGIFTQFTTIVRGD